MHKRFKDIFYAVEVSDTGISIMRGVSYLVQGTKNYLRNITEDSVLGPTIGLGDKLKQIGGLTKNPLKTLKREAALDGRLINFNGQRHIRAADIKATQLADRLKSGERLSLSEADGRRNISFPDGISIYQMPGEPLSTLSITDPSKNKLTQIPVISYRYKPTADGTVKTQALEFSRPFLSGSKSRQQISGVGIVDPSLTQLLEAIDAKFNSLPTDLA